MHYCYLAPSITESNYVYTVRLQRFTLRLIRTTVSTPPVKLHMTLNVAVEPIVLGEAGTEFQTEVHRRTTLSD